MENTSRVIDRIMRRLKNVSAYHEKEQNRNIRINI